MMNVERKLDVTKIVSIVKKAGYSSVPNFFDLQVCKDFKKEIDFVISNRRKAVLLDASKSDNRIFGMEHISEKIRNLFFNNVDILNVLNSLYGVRKIKVTVLAQHVKALSSNTGSGASWHRDSLPKQYKAFLFLSDVTQESGPFQFIDKSQYLFNKIKSIYRQKDIWRKIDYSNAQIK